MNSSRLLQVFAGLVLGPAAKKTIYEKSEHATWNDISQSHKYSIPNRNNRISVKWYIITFPPSKIVGLNSRKYVDVQMSKRITRIKLEKSKKALMVYPCLLSMCCWYYCGFFQQWYRMIKSSDSDCSRTSRVVVSCPRTSKVRCHPFTQGSHGIARTKSRSQWRYPLHLHFRQQGWMRSDSHFYKMKQEMQMQRRTSLAKVWTIWYWQEVKGTE